MSLDDERPCLRCGVFARELQAELDIANQRIEELNGDVENLTRICNETNKGGSNNYWIRMKKRYRG